MTRHHPRPESQSEMELRTLTVSCPVCGGVLRADYMASRTVIMLAGPMHVRLQVRRCHNQAHSGDKPCKRYFVPFRPEMEGRLALPQHAIGLDVILMVGIIRQKSENISIDNIYKYLIKKHIKISKRSVFNTWDAFRRIINLRNDPIGWRTTKERIAREGTMILAIDDLWGNFEYVIGSKAVLIMRDCLTSQIIDVMYQEGVVDNPSPHLAQRIRAITAEFRVPIHSVVFSERSQWIGEACRRELPDSPQLRYPIGGNIEGSQPH